MRNLIILNRGSIRPESRTYPDLELVDSVFDSVSDSITFVLTSEESNIVEVQQFMKNGELLVLASFPVSGYSKLLSFNHFVETNQLILVFENGDIVSATYDPAQPDYDTTFVEIVGSIDIGLLASTWSPDEETLSILTKDNKLVLLSRLFEPIREMELNPDDIKITDSMHVSVGWGKKETQFKGKGFKAMEREREALKHAGLDLKEDSPLRDPTVAEVEKGTVSDLDDQSQKISWRGDGQYFSVTTIEPVLVEDTSELFERRVIRVFTREGELNSVNEAVDGLEHNLAWKPQGSLIASTQRHVDEDGDETLDVVFYERNGLRRGQFNSRLNPFTEILKNLEWSADSEVLLFQLHDRVQLWTTKNYHWYLKQEIHISKNDVPTNHIVFAKFHPEKPLHLMIGTNAGLEIIDLAYKVVTGPTELGNDIGMTLVTDGSLMKITPLSVASVPPPISFRELEVLDNINDLAASKSNHRYAALTSMNEVLLSELSIEDMKEGKHPQVTSKIDNISLGLDGNEFAKQVSFIGDNLVAIAVDGPTKSRIIVFDIENFDSPMFKDSVELPTKIVILKSQADFSGVAAEGIDGTVYRMNAESELQTVTRFPQLCRDFELSKTTDDESESNFVAFGLSGNGKLFANDEQVANAVTSLKITESHLLFTTAHSQLCFMHLKPANGSFDFQVFQNSNHHEEIIDERIRQIERGSILINAMPSKYSVVLEAPRGNLETICPRIMVVSGVRNYIMNKQYKEAFLTCRTHRIDLDILHDYDPELFLSNIELFVNQIQKVEHLDLFVSCLHEEDVTVTKYKETLNESDDLTKEVQTLQISERQQPVQSPLRKIIKNKEDHTEFKNSKINKICEAILSVLKKPEYFETYLQTIITAFACEKPPNLVEALKLVGSFSNKEQTEQAVTHLCFLQDVNKIYNTALGLYDVRLTLGIAQQSQKDPKEYLPFLQNLHVQPELRRKFLIDDHLKNHEKALNWLFEIGVEAHQEFNDYMIDHDLYKPALAIYKYDEARTTDIYRLYAGHLNSKQLFSEAGLTYEYLSDLENALENYILGKKWKEALAITQHEEYSDKVVSAATRLVSSLSEDHKYSEAAEIEFYFLNNIEEAIRLYCNNYNYTTAILLATKENKTHLIESVVDNQLNEGFGTIAELIADCKGQFNSQLKRLRELRTKKQEDPYSFYGVPDELDTPDNVSVAASETSTTPSFFTRYTGKTSGTAKTGASRRTTKNKKREERKRAKGRKGTIYEEEYLIKSVGRMLDRLDETQADGVSLIEGLIRRKSKEKAYQIQNNWIDLLDLIRDNIHEIHNMSERDRERIDENGDVYLIDEIPIPKINEFPKKNILDY